MRVLVTGAAGLVGSAVAARLAREHEVVGLDLRPGRCVELRRDVRDPPSLAGFDAVVHVAALHAPDVGRAPEAAFRAVNVDGTARLIEAALAAGVRRFVYTSSTSVWGRALEPRDGRAAWIDETVPPEPRDIYDETKLAAEALIRGSGLSHAILRMSRCFPEPLPAMAIHRLHRGIDRRDVARAHAVALESGLGGTWLVGAPPPFRPEDRALIVADAAAAIRLRAPAVADAFDRRSWPLPPSLGRVYSPAKARAELGLSDCYSAEAVLAGDCAPPPLAA